MTNHPRLARVVMLLAIAIIAPLFAQEPATTGKAVEESTFGGWLPHYLCLKPPCCVKPLPQLPSWCFAKCCDDYCPKPLPCLPSPCLKYCCDDYQRKAAPCCFPPDPCRCFK